MSQPLMQSRKARADHGFVRFEQRHVDGVEADDGHVEADVELGDAGAEVVGPFGGGAGGEVGFDLVEVQE